MNRPAIIPPIADDDRLPDDRAVWRDPPGPGDVGAVPVTVIYGDTGKERTTANKVDWEGVTRWRFGWPPKGGPSD